MSIHLSEMQVKALERIKNWYEHEFARGKQFFYLGGYAGTGKTTIEQFATEGIKGRICRAAFTGKAALRMQQVSKKPAQTLHSLIYSVEEGKDGRPQFTVDLKHSYLVGAAALVLDECSMVNEPLGFDVLKFGIPVLVLGDPGQLPPIEGAGFFTKRNPDSMLTEVHRQALDNPIIRLATDIRNGKTVGRSSDERCEVYPLSRDVDINRYLVEYEQILTGTNRTRTAINKIARRGKGTFPEIGDKLICLRNNKVSGIFNGMLATVSEVLESDETRVLLNLETDLGPRNHVDIWPECFTDPDLLKTMPYRERVEMDEFDYGYAITVHKAQGSQWNSVCILDDDFLKWKKDDRAKWLYTGVTRAAERLVLAKYKAPNV